MIILFIGLLALMFIIIGCTLDTFYTDNKFIPYWLMLAILFISICTVSLIIKYLGS